MTKKGEIIQFASQIIENEASAISSLKAKLDEDLAETVALILESKGNLVFSGIGKSALHHRRSEEKRPSCPRGRGAFLLLLPQ